MTPGEVQSATAALRREKQRRDVVIAVDAGMPHAAVAELHDISTRSAFRWLKAGRALDEGRQEQR